MSHPMVFCRVFGFDIATMFTINSKQSDPGIPKSIQIKITGGGGACNLKSI